MQTTLRRARAPMVAAVLAATTLAMPARAQAQQGDQHYALEALKIEGADIGEKIACYLKIYANGRDPAFERQYGSAMEVDMAEFSRRVEAYIARFTPRKDALSLPVFRFQTWHNLNFFIDRKESAIREAPDASVMGRCNLVAATSIERRKTRTPAAPRGGARR